jgi:hypothetical protein
MKYLILLIPALIIPYLAHADCPGDTCAAERRSLYLQQDRCKAILSQSAKDSCWSGPAYQSSSSAYQGCMRMCNQQGHAKTMEKKRQNKNPVPLTDAMTTTSNAEKNTLDSNELIRARKEMEATKAK